MDMIISCNLKSREILKKDFGHFVMDKHEMNLKRYWNILAARKVRRHFPLPLLVHFNLISH